MQFTADSAKIKRWREERHWSQEHLADLAGIGLRTVQRIENGETASGESLKALAAAFNVDVMALTVDAKTEAERIIQQKQARVSAVMRLVFLIHFGSYLLGMLIFAGISLGSGADYYVMLWPSIWWTVGVAGHALAVFIVEVTRHYDPQINPSK